MARTTPAFTLLVLASDKCTQIKATLGIASFAIAEQRMCVLWLPCRISESLGMLCAGLFRTELIGSIVLQGLYVPLLMFVGFFQVRADRRKAMTLP